MKIIVYGAAVMLFELIFAPWASARERVLCESVRNKREYCDIRGAYDADIELSRQLSDSSCIEGISWGRDNRGVWVDDGCRAEFTILRRYNDRYPRDYERDRYYDDERRDLERERRKLEEERRRLEEERAHAQQPAETCPPGMRPGRCNDNQRSRGCKDFRLPGGLGCMTRM